MLNRIAVRRSRPSVAAYITAFLLTAAMVMCALASARIAKQAVAPAAFSERITRTLTLEGGQFYMLSTGAFEDDIAARVAAASSMSIGAAGYLRKTGIRTFVLAAAYRDAETADGVRMRLSDDYGISSNVLDYSFSDVSLNVTAAKEQTDALTSAYEALINSEKELLSVVYALEESEITLAAARARLKTCARQLTQAADIYEGHLGRDPDAPCRTLLTLVRETAGRIQAAAVGKQAYFISAVRHAHIGGVMRRRDFLSSLES